MGFKKSDDTFSKDIKFKDQLKSVVIEEAGRFTGEGNEAASADLDQGAETLLRLSAEKNKKRREAIKAEIRHAGLDKRPNGNQKTNGNETAISDDDQMDINEETIAEDLEEEEDALVEAESDDIEEESTDCDVTGTDTGIGRKEAAIESAVSAAMEDAANDAKDTAPVPRDPLSESEPEVITPDPDGFEDYDD